MPNSNVESRNNQLPVKSNAQEQLKNAPKEKSWSEYLYSLGDEAVNDMKNSVKNSYNSVSNSVQDLINTTESNINDISKWGADQLNWLDKMVSDLSSSVREWVNSGWIKTIDFLDKTWELIVNGVSYKLQVVAWWSRYLLKLGSNWISYVTTKWKEIWLNTALKMQKAYTDVLAWGQKAGQDVAKLANSIPGYVESGYYKTVDFVSATGELVLDGVKYGLTIAIGAWMYALKAGKEWFVYVSNTGKEIKLAVMLKAQKAYSNVVIRGKKTGQDVTAIVNAIPGYLESGYNKTVDFVVATGELVLDGVKYGLTIAIGAWMYALKAGKEWFVYVSNTGKEIKLAVMLKAQKAYSNVVIRGKKTGQDVTAIVNAIPGYLESGYNKTVDFVVATGELVLDGVKYGLTIAIGAWMYALKAGKEWFVYVSNTGKEIKLAVMLKAQKAYSNVVIRGKKTGQDVTAIVNAIPGYLESGYNKTVDFVVATGELVLDGVKYGLTIAIGAWMYALKAGKEWFVYVSNTGKEIKLAVMLKAQKAYSNVVIRGKKTGQDVTAIVNAIPGYLESGYNKTVDFVVATGELVLDGVKYGLTIAIGAWMYALKAGKEWFVYVSNTGKEIKLAVMLKAQKAYSNVVIRGKKTGQDVTAMSNTLAWYVEDGLIQSLYFIDGTNKMVVQTASGTYESSVQFVNGSRLYIMSNGKKLQEDSYKKFLQESNLQDPSLWNQK
jgi:predicted regulator of Ras-like GTPase activity (Roadblock/LC7/MglB family)